LRKKIGDVVFLFDGKGNEYEAEIVKINESQIEFKIISTTQKDIEIATKINLYQSIPKFKKFDFIIEKATELGVSKIIPVISERTQYSIPSESRNFSKLSRWQKIALSASKQSGRSVITEISAIKNFKDALESLSIDSEKSLSIIPWECEENTNLKNILRTMNQEIRTINLFIGPEGGFSSSEINIAQKCGVIPVSLGKRILRTETAPIFVISNILYELDL